MQQADSVFHFPAQKQSWYDRRAVNYLPMRPPYLVQLQDKRMGDWRGLFRPTIRRADWLVVKNSPL
jgi:hypothetical protein